MKNLMSFIILLFFISCSSRERIEIEDLSRECDFSIFHGLKPDMETDDFFSVLGEPNDWYDGEDEDDRHCPVYYFDNYKLKGYWDGEYPEIGVIEFIPYDNTHYTIDQFLSNPQKYGINQNTKRFDIYYNGIWWFEVFLENYRVERIQYWMED